MSLLLQKKKLLLAVFFLIAFALFGKYILYDVMTPNQRYGLTTNPIGYRVVASWHSVRKFANIVHLPYWFRKTTLPVYTIEISPQNLIELDQSIPRSPNGLEFGKLLEDDKAYVKARFITDTGETVYDQEVKIRLRGLLANNWNATKKAYRIKFPKNAYFEGQRALNLFLPYDRAYFAEPLNAYRAQKLGLFTPQFSFARVKINGRDNGIYLVSEPWSKELLARNNIVDTNNIFTTKDIPQEARVSLFSSAGKSNWRSYTAETEGQPFPELETLISLIESTDDETFTRLVPGLVDLDKVYAWQILNILAGSNHQTDFDNAILLFRKETGLFEPVPWDVHIYAPTNFVYEDTTRLVDRVLSQPTFFAEFQKALAAYVTDESQHADDLRFYDDMYARLKPEFYADQAKLDTDAMFDAKVASHREYIVKNAEAAKAFVERSAFHENLTPFVPSGTFAPGSGFEHLGDTSLDRRSFVRKHPIFSEGPGNTVRLKTGTYRLAATLFIPRGLQVQIDPGVQLLFEDDVSLISYSPVRAVGTPAQPIVFADATPDNTKPWGVFAVVNSPDEVSQFSHVSVTRGSTAHYNGIFFTSQFSLHNANTIIEHSTFSDNLASDDTVHVILGRVELKDSRIVNAFADGIDLDYTTDSLIVDSFFDNTKPQGEPGDAIDVSGVVRTTVSDTDIQRYGDKCISVGEQSVLTVIRTTMETCGIGIATKDSSHAVVEESRIQHNTVGIARYQKKPEFLRPGTITLTETRVENNMRDIEDLAYVPE